MAVMAFFNLYAQHYDRDKLNTVARIWGEVYLFHPSVVKSGGNPEWEKALVEFLPVLSGNLPNEEFIRSVNSNLLSKLNDTFTIVQNRNLQDNGNLFIFNSGPQYDYIRVSEDDISDISRLVDFNSMIKDRNSSKPLVIDIRVNKELNFDHHTRSFMDYLMSMFVDQEIPGSMLVNREHFGWDEYNDWWYFEQRWKVKNKDKSGNADIEPLSAYSQEIRQYIPDFNGNDFQPVTRTIYLLTNNSSLSYFYPLLSAMKHHRNNFFIINENSGYIYPHESSEFIIYPFRDFDFILNPVLCINEGKQVKLIDFHKNHLQENELLQFIGQKPEVTETINPFTFDIAPPVYIAQGETLSKEEKILGIVKIWTIVKYFYAYPEHMDIDWESSLGKYLEEAQKTTSDKDYFMLVQKMMSHLHDSHVSTFHPSVLDFSAIFAAPVYFDYIEDKIIITDFDPEIIPGIQVGDEIISIDGQTVTEILENGKNTISHSNLQGLISVLMNPGNFVGLPGSMMKMEIRHHNKISEIEIPRTVPIFQLMGMAEKRGNSEILGGNIGYLNFSFVQSPEELEAQLRSMQNTESLIIDLRGYPSVWDYDQFLSMLFDTGKIVRIDKTPVVSATSGNLKQIQTNQYELVPDPSFSYNKPVAVLIDKTMISRAEDIAICLKALSNVTFIGERTQGTDGEMTKISLPGGGETSFTGQAILFGNGDKFQSEGIKPDIRVSKSVQGIKEGKDEILEKALEFLRK